MLNRRFELKMMAALACLALFVAHPAGQSTSQSAPRTILAIGAHSGDMEITCGAVLALQKKKGDRVALLHLTLGEGGNPKLSPQVYGEQKRREALAAAKALGADVIFGPYQDGQLPNTEEARRYVADVIRQVKPSSFAYLDYYDALARVRGAEARKRYAVAFEVDPMAKKRVLDSLP